MEPLFNAMEVIDRMRGRPDYTAVYAPRVAKLKAQLVVQLTRDGMIASTPFLLGQLTGVLQSRQYVIALGLHSHIIHDSLLVMALALSELIISATEPLTP